jgi:hypothetical protein
LPVEEKVFRIAVFAWLILLVWWVGRTVLRWLAVIVYRRPRQLVERQFKRQGVMVVLALLAGAALAYGWPHRQARWWARHKMAPTTVRGTNWGDREFAEVMRTAAIRLPERGDRVNALAVVVRQPAGVALGILLDVVRREEDAGQLATVIQLIGLYRERSTLDLLLGFLEHKESKVRAAAADAIGLLHKPAYRVPVADEEPVSGQTAAMAEASEISLVSLLSRGGRYSALSEESIELPASVRERLVQMVSGGATLEEREAAARALVAWPAEKYQLRVAEWGVWAMPPDTWTAHHGAGVVPAAARREIMPNPPAPDDVVTDIPPFVHRVGIDWAELRRRQRSNLKILKPVLHVTADQVMTLDVEVRIDGGRPWYAFPKYDDLTAGQGGPNVRVEFSPPGGNPSAETPQNDLREGYPWLTPSHRAIPPGIHENYNLRGYGSGLALSVSGVGLRWQSVIVSPRKLPWMNGPAVPAGEQYAWWKRLREVECAWVSSRGESERFLYYDGPSARPAPVTPTLSGQTLAATPNSPRAGPAREAWYVEVGDGKVRGKAVSAYATGWTESVGREGMTEGKDAVVGGVRKLLTERGLSEAEAGAMMDSWRREWFETPGKRLLLLLSREDYDEFCPMTIRPAPTTWVRVGVMWTEF